MPDEKSSRRSASRKKTVRKTAGKKPPPEKKPGSSQINKEKEKPSQKLDKTIGHLKEFGNTLNRTSNTSGVHNSNNEPQDNIALMKNKFNEITGKIQHIARDIPLLKLELHNLHRDRENYLLLTGERVRNMYKSNNLRNIRSKLKTDFERLDELERLIEEKESEVLKLSEDLRMFK